MTLGPRILGCLLLLLPLVSPVETGQQELGAAAGVEGGQAGKLLLLHLLPLLQLLAGQSSLGQAAKVGGYAGGDQSRPWSKIVSMILWTVYNMITRMEFPIMRMELDDVL